MMTVNVNTNDGLVNGATGRLERIDCGTYDGPDGRSYKPLRIWIRFDNERSGRSLRAINRRLVTGTGADPSCTPLEPVVQQKYQRKGSNLVVNRTQFPIVVAEAITIHKNQGGTYDTVIIKLPQRQMHRSLMYVACSRVTTSNGLFLIGTRFEKTSPPKPTDSIAQESARLETVQLRPSFRHLRAERDNEMQLIFHNI